MFLLTTLWRWWTEGWRSPQRARLTYVVMTIGFAGLAIVAVMLGRGLVAGVASVVAIVTLGLAVVAPRLVRLAERPRDIR